MNTHSSDSGKDTFAELTPAAAMAARLIVSHNLPEELYRFLAKPLNASANRNHSIAPKNSNVHLQLMDLVAPLMRSNLIESHQAADLAEPVAAGIGSVLKHLVETARDGRDKLNKQVVLTCLMPVYLAVGQNKVDDSLMQTLTLFRDYVCLQQINRQLGDELSVYLANQVSSKYTPQQTLEDSLSINLRSTAVRFFTNSITEEKKPSGLIELADEYAIKLWNLAAQWIAGNGVVSVDASMSLKRVDWNRLQVHWIDLWQLIESTNDLTCESANDEQWSSMDSNSKRGFASSANNQTSLTESDTNRRGRRDSGQHPHRRGAVGQESTASREVARGLDQCESLLNSLDNQQIDLSEVNHLDSASTDGRSELPHPNCQDEVARDIGTHQPNLDVQEKQIAANDGVIREAVDKRNSPPQTTSQSERRNFGKSGGHEKSSNAQDISADTESDTDLQHCVEIRKANDPNLMDNLRLTLQQCRDRAGAISIVIIQASWTTETDTEGLDECNSSNWFIALMESIKSDLHIGDIRCFSIDENEFGFVVEEHDRNEITSLVREAIENLRTSDINGNMLAADALPSLSCGIAFASSPAKTCTIESLMESASRCLKAAARQGNGVIKSIEVF